jgi:site-specific DNA recombinase
MEHRKHPVRRCAVYTRKSSEEGLEQDFNSLHAQRDACEAFIRSQAGEGWRLSKAHYDDGGLSGGPWSVQHCNGCWRTSGTGWSMWW